MAEDLIGSDNALSATQRRTLNRVLDLIVPASADGVKPSAAEVGVLDYIRDHEAATLPALANEIGRLETEVQEQHGVAFADLDAASGQALVEAMQAADPTLFRTLALQTVTCYYQDARVLEAIGLEARPPFPEGYEVPAGDLTLLEPVRRRGSRVREA